MSILFATYEFEKTHGYTVSRYMSATKGGGDDKVMAVYETSIHILIEHGIFEAD